MSNLSRATWRTLHSVRRKAAGEHHVPTETLVQAFAEEWGLSALERALLLADVEKLEQEIAAILEHGGSGT